MLETSAKFGLQAGYVKFNTVNEVRIGVPAFSYMYSRTESHPDMQKISVPAFNYVHSRTGLIGKESHPDMQKIRVIGFFFENRLHWQFAVRLLLFTVCTC